MEKVTPGNGKMPEEDGGPSGDEAIRLLSEQVEKLSKELDQVWRDTESRWADTMSTLNQILLQQAATMPTSTATTALAHPIPTIHSRPSNEPAEEERTPVRPSKEMLPPREVPLPTGHPQTVNLYRHVTLPEFSGKRSKFRDFASSLRIYFDLNR